jgi:hypothetical protein
VQAFPSLQGVPFARAGLEQDPVAGLHVPAAWHWSAALHETGLVPAHAPDRHVSVFVQAFPSLHGVPSASVGLEHAPVAGLHAPAVWHGSAAVHVTGLLPTHTPARHVSVRVQEFPSLQAVPSGAAGFEHVPVWGSHVPAGWHESSEVHTTPSHLFEPPGS